MRGRTAFSFILAGALLLAPSAAAAADDGRGENVPPPRRESALEEFLRRAERRTGPAVSAVRPMRPWPVKTKDSGGTLLFSDSPEYVKSYGILYSDVVKGNVRVFCYHLNETSRPGKLAVVLENERQRRTRVRLLRSALATPSDNYLQVGKETETEYMTLPQRRQELIVGPAARRVLDPRMETVPLKPGELGAGVYDLKLSAPLRVAVVFCPENADPAAFVSGARLLPRDEVALRGTFPNMNRTIKAKRAYRPERDGIVYIPIGDDRSDLYKEGRDATDGKAARNDGNYGVVYRFEIPTRGETPTHLWLSPLGGVYAGAVRVRCGDEERLVPTPADRLFFGEKSPAGLPDVFDGEMKLAPDFELTDLGIFPAGEKITVEYSPPGASNLPALLILAPGDGETAAANACRTEEEE